MLFSVKLRPLLAGGLCVLRFSSIASDRVTINLLNCQTEPTENASRYYYLIY